MDISIPKVARPGDPPSRVGSVAQRADAAFAVVEQAIGDLQKSLVDLGEAFDGATRLILSRINELAERVGAAKVETPLAEAALPEDAPPAEEAPAEPPAAPKRTRKKAAPPAEG